MAVLAPACHARQVFQTFFPFVGVLGGFGQSLRHDLGAVFAIAPFGDGAAASGARKCQHIDIDFVQYALAQQLEHKFGAGTRGVHDFLGGTLTIRMGSYKQTDGIGHFTIFLFALFAQQLMSRGSNEDFSALRAIFQRDGGGCF